VLFVAVASRWRISAATTADRCTERLCICHCLILVQLCNLRKGEREADRIFDEVREAGVSICMAVLVWGAVACSWWT